MPTFTPGVQKTAVAKIPLSPAGLQFGLELWLGPNQNTKTATSGVIPVTAVGGTQSVNMPVVLPATPSTYHVYLRVTSGGIPLGAYQATEDVVIATLTPPLYSIVGLITDVDTGKPLSGVFAGLDSLVGGQSNDSGYYELSGMVEMYGIAKQWKTLSFTKTYYATITYDVSGLSGDVKMDVKMKQVLYPCPICGATFATKAELDAHLATAHLDWNFTGSLSAVCIEPTVEYGCGRADISYSISNPSAPNFKWALMYWDYGWSNTYQKGGNGPGSGAVRCSGGAILYAHPNPSAVLAGYWSEAGGFVQTSDFKEIARIGGHELGSL